jgi:hypothetical protein
MSLLGGQEGRQAGKQAGRWCHSFSFFLSTFMADGGLYNNKRLSNRTKNSQKFIYLS